MTVRRPSPRGRSVFDCACPVHILLFVFCYIRTGTLNCCCSFLLELETILDHQCFVVLACCCLIYRTSELDLFVVLSICSCINVRPPESPETAPRIRYRPISMPVGWNSCLAVVAKSASGSFRQCTDTCLICQYMPVLDHFLSQFMPIQQQIMQRSVKPLF